MTFKTIAKTVGAALYGAYLGNISAKAIGSDSDPRIRRLIDNENHPLILIPNSSDIKPIIAGTVIPALTSIIFKKLKNDDSFHVVAGGIISYMLTLISLEFRKNNIPPVETPNTQTRINPTNYMQLIECLRNGENPIIGHQSCEFHLYDRITSNQNNNNIAMLRRCLSPELPTFIREAAESRIMFMIDMMDVPTYIDRQYVLHEEIPNINYLSSRQRTMVSREVALEAIAQDHQMPYSVRNHARLEYNRLSPLNNPPLGIPTRQNRNIQTQHNRPQPHRNTPTRTSHHTATQRNRTYFDLNTLRYNDIPQATDDMINSLSDDERCPISCENLSEIRQPVLLRNGTSYQLYEFDALMTWFSSRNTDPMTRERYTAQQLLNPTNPQDRILFRIPRPTPTQTSPTS